MMKSGFLPAISTIDEGNILRMVNLAAYFTKRRGAPSELERGGDRAPGFGVRDLHNQLKKVNKHAGKVHSPGAPTRRCCLPIVTRYCKQVLTARQLAFIIGVALGP